MNRITTGEIENEKTNDEYIDENQRLIIEMVKKIDNIDNLKRIYELSKYLYIYK